ncbi:MAG TPA: caspase family protein, partial [Candidatus Tectomicrobia bacterium]|nr:caspase family protein [Candidatus Tectomicrobia bacterium]
GQNTVTVTGIDVDGRIAQEVRTLHLSPRVPTTIAFRYPAEGASLASESTVVAATVTAGAGIARVRVLLNGVAVHEQEEAARPSTALVVAPVALRAGANAIVVSAATADGTVHEATRTVTYAPARPASVPVAAPPPRPEPDRWAVVIGIGTYESRAIPPLAYSVRDAEAVHRVLTGPGGYKPEHVLLLTDRTTRRPTLRNIKWALGTFLARSARKDDTVLIYFAGHGAPEIDQRGVERDGLSKYLVPSDADPDDLYSSALPMEELHTIFGRLEAERVVVFLDACYSGAAGGRTFASRKMRATHVDDLFLERLGRSRGRAIVTAARPSEIALEVSDLGHGLFTYYLIRGLEGLADVDRDGIVALQELYDYLEREVSARSRQVGGNQHPVLKGELEGSLPLIRVAPRPR